MIHRATNQIGTNSRRTSRTLLGAAVLLALTASQILASPISEDEAERIWRPIGEEQLRVGGLADVEPRVRPDRFQGYLLGDLALDSVLSSAPVEFTPEADTAEAILSLPRPDATLERFSLVESPVMHPDLEDWMADQGWPMRTYLGTSLDHPASRVRLDWGGPEGFHALVDSPGGDYMVEPYWPGDSETYVSFYRADHPARAYDCGVVADLSDADRDRTAASLGAGTGGALRTYRLAVAAQGEYTAQHGGTQVGGQAAVVTAINRVNMVYERDLSIRLILVADNMDVIFTDSETDPYTADSCNNDTLFENAVVLSVVLGPASFDIGHVFNTSNGGVALGGVVCSDEPSPTSPFKAAGCTGRPDPQGDPFWIDFVAHEMGHQFDALHTFNGENGDCAGHFVSGSAYEPGSGSTVMAYAGICGADDLQDHGDDHFHRHSLDQIQSFVAGAGNCSTDVAGVNPAEPQVEAGADYTIPSSTPFELTAEASDSDGDSLTFNWEQFDLGTQAPLLTGDDGVQPIFRSWPSTTSSIRTFPRLSDLLVGVTAAGEILPITNRTMAFQVTARDNRAGGGREGNDSMTVTSTTTAGPFEVLIPNGGESLSGEQLIEWDPAGTAAAPVSAATVDLLLSTDGGLSFPHTLASSVANDGAHELILPAIESETARVKIKATGNVFFDVSDADFSILAPADDTPLANGLALSESIVGTTQQGDWNYYYAVLEGGGIDDLVVDLFDLTADLDLYVRFGAKPDLATYDCRPFEGGTTAEQCSFSDPDPGTWWVGVNNWDTGTIHYSIRANWVGLAVIFQDGFESGDTSAWSEVVP